MVQEITERYLRSTQQNKNIRQIFWTIAAYFSLAVILGVFWYLKLTGITMAGEAFCGKAEHTHSERCQPDCTIEEHIHIESCYSDISADLETEDDWEMSFADVGRGSTTAENVVLLAQSQLGCGESTLNFQVGTDGIRRGITRYGQWYGNPYGDWSAMFASFCLYYAGVEDVPLNAGAETMRINWEKQGLYKSAETFAPRVGDLMFLQKGTSTGADTVAIIVEVTDGEVHVIEGDVNEQVTRLRYAVNSTIILGYGLVPETSEYAVLVEPPESTIAIGAVSTFTGSMLTSSNRFVLYIQQGGNTYAIDGAGNAVQVYINNGNIWTDAENPDDLLWTFARYNNSSTAIQNVGTGRYLHPYYNAASDNGITTPGRWGTTVTASGTGVRFSHSAYIRFNEAGGTFEMTRTQSENVTFQLGMSSPCTVWLDGTNGGIMSLGGSDDLGYAAYTQSTLTLPTSWKSPNKYHYVLKGWYDITNHKYYAPGDKVIVTGNMVFYADWKAATYDVGQFNSQTTPSISTNQFVTTRLFDYGVLMNVLSERANVTVSSTGHSETWNLLTTGDNLYNGQEVFDFIFRDWDRGGEDISYPNGHNDRNNPTDAGTVYMGLYTEAIRQALFDPDVTLPGKEYLGTADYLFQLCQNPEHNHYGYYYYNSERNAASYNQTDQRFYIYEYLECTRDSLNNSDEGKYSDFLPFNSPYANSNGRNPTLYSYEGIEGEYVGTTHYMYDSRYNDNDNTTANIGTNFWFGMSVEVSFYIPNAPGAIVSDGGFGNKDVYGEDMHFRFTGDDDVWIFVDDKMVLDLGGLHGRETGDINFSTGEVSINGVRNDAFSRILQSVAAGEHTLTLYYLERGSSMSNCAIYFNLAPRFAFSIQKEDVLTKEVLNGAQFSVYTDKACTVPAQLWTSKEAHDNGEASTHMFTVTDGVARMWGMGAGNLYYIRETKPPDKAGYGFANGLICLAFDKSGTASYNVEIIDEGSGISPGFIVHGFRIDAETQEAYIIATNAPQWVEETTSVQVYKHWDDALDHSGDSVTVYLTVRRSDGTVLRLQEAILNEETNWMGRWDNLPKYAQDGVTPIQYGVEESYASGYYSAVERVQGDFVITKTHWVDTTRFENGKVYLLKNAAGLALSTLRSAEDTGYMWVDAEEAKTSALALWTASVSGNNVRLTNQAGQTITFYYGNGSPTDFFALNQHLEDNNRKQYFTYSQTANGIVLRFNNYYLGNSLNSSQKFVNTTQSGSALVLVPCTEQVVSTNIAVEEQGFLVTNTPLERETSVTVRKVWQIPADMNSSVFEQAQVTVRLYANGVDTGRTITLNLKNNWGGVFKGLPYEDDHGNVIAYSVEEVETSDRWIISYGEMTATGGATPDYSTTITNTYRTGGPILPTTGSAGRLMYIFCGTGILLGTLIYGFWLRRKKERG